MPGNPLTEQMRQTIKQRIVPVLRSKGFRGTFPHFQRLMDDRIDLLMFQFSSWGGRFCVELGTCGANGSTLASGTHIPPESLRVNKVLVRKRLGAVPPNTDRWFAFDDAGSEPGDDAFVRRADEVTALLEGEAEDWWSIERDHLKG